MFTAPAGLVKKIEISYTQGNNGGPRFSVNYNNESMTVGTNQFVNSIQGGILNTLNPALKNGVQVKLVQAYQLSTQQANSILSCSYSGDLNAPLGGTFSWAGLDALVHDPACNPIGARLLADDLVNSVVANAVQNNAIQLGWGQGTYPITATDAFGNVNVVTPAAVVLNQAEQALQAGLLKTENAQDLGQMVGALFAGIGAQAVSSAQGLAGITQSSGGQPSYIDQVTAAASRGVTSAIGNAALTTLNGVLAVVTGYMNALTNIATTLKQAIQSLQGTEAQCWKSIIQDVCVAGSIQVSSTGGETCTQVPASLLSTSTPSVTLKIATSTAFSNAVIQAQIAPLANNTITNICSAQTALTAISQLIAGVTNTNSADAQALAISQLDQLTASNSFPQPSVIRSAQQQSTSITTTMQTLINQTVQNWQGIDGNGGQTISWDGSVSPGNGWCNYNDQKTLLEWEAVWKQ